MSFIRSFSGFVLALAIGYAAGVLMCIDAYHLGQSSVIAHDAANADMTCLPPRQALDLSHACVYAQAPVTPHRRDIEPVRVVAFSESAP